MKLWKIFVMEFGIIVSTAQAQVAQQVTSIQIRDDLKKIESSIEYTKEKIKTVKDVQFLPDLYFALAEFYVDKSRYGYALKVMENKKVKSEDLDFTLEKRSKYLAIEYYDQIIDRFPKLPERDRALFFKAHELRELGRFEEMLHTYRSLTKEYPNSTYWDESTMAIADFLFEEQKNFSLALVEYQKIIKRPRGPFTSLAHYKMGWVQINLHNFKKALSEYESVILNYQEVDPKNLPDQYKKSDVRRDAMIALAWPYSELLPKDFKTMKGLQRTDVVKYLFDLSPDRISYEKALLKMANRFELKQRFSEMTRMYFEALKISTDILTRTDLIERTYFAMKNTQKRDSIKGYVCEVADTMYRIQTADRFKAGQKKKFFHDFEIFARDIATRTHEKAKSTGDNDLYQEAISDYKCYLDGFPSTSQRKSIILNLAEISYRIKDYRTAGIYYEQMTKFFARNSKDEKEFLYSSVEAFTQALKSPDKLNRLFLTECRSGLRDVGKILIEKEPKSPSAQSIRFNIAQSYYDERKFDKAVSLFKEYVKLYPGSSSASIAVNLILDSHNQREDYRSLVKDGKDIIANPSITDSSLKESVRQIIQQAEVKIVQNKAGEVDSPNYSLQLLKLANSNRGNTLGEAALYEAFISQKAKHDPGAFNTGEQLILNYKNSSKVNEVILEMAKMATLSADYEKAALYFEIYAEQNKGRPEIKEFLGNAARFREAIGDYKNAGRDYKTQGDMTSLARMDFLAQDWASLRSSATAASGISAAYWEGLAAYRLGKFTEAVGPLGVVGSTNPRSPEDAEMVGHSLFLVMMMDLNRFKDIRLGSGNDAKTVKDKADVLKEISGKVDRIVKIGSGRWAIAGLYVWGQANQEFGNFLKSAPLPQGLTGAQQVQYQELIGKQAQQYFVQSNSAFKQCLLSGEKFEVFSRFVRGCQSQGRLQVDEYKEMARSGTFSSRAPANVSSLKVKLYGAPRDKNLLITLSDTYLGQGNYQMGSAVLSRAHEIAPENDEIMGRLGNIYLFSNDFEKAKWWFKKAIEKNPKSAIALWGMAGLTQTFGYRGPAQVFVGKAQKSGFPRISVIHPVIKAQMK